MRSVFHILVLVLLSFTVSAQKVKWESTTVNFGSIGDWNSPPASFKFTNTGNQKLMFLPQRHDREVLVRYPNQSFLPGESGEITVFYYTGDTGPFSRTVEVYTNGSNKPERLTLKGNIRSIYANALTACPSFQEPSPARVSEPNVIQVLDATTERPIPNASVEVFDRGIRKAINGTNLEGVAVNWIEPGKYIAVAFKEGYEKSEMPIAFTKRDRTQIVYLQRKSPIADSMEEEIAGSVEGRWDETPKREYQDPVMEAGQEHLGVTTNVLLEEEYRSLEESGSEVSTNDVLAEEANTVDRTEEFDLGVGLNDQWDEPAKATEETQVQTEPAIVDLGITTNERLEEEKRQSDALALQKQIEMEVEAALREAENTIASNEVVNPVAEPEFSTEKYRPNNVLLLLDVSGSMKDDGKMDKLKSSIRRLVMMLRDVDVLTMIAYNSDSWELLPPTPVTDNQSIVMLVDSLQPYGYTNGVKGMETAYESLERQIIQGGNNQLIIATDGKFNSSKFSERDAIDMVKANVDKGIVLSIIGFGEDREAGRLMRRLADLGKGSFLQVNDNEDPTELLAEEIKLRSVK